MAISFVAAGAVVTGNNPLVPLPTGWAVNDLLIIHISADVSSTTPSGWTLLVNQGTTAPKYQIFWKIATSSETSVGLGMTSTVNQCVMVAYRGASGIDVVSSGVLATSATTISTNSLTTSQANEYVVSFYGATTGVETWTAPVSTISRVDDAGTGSHYAMLIVDELQTAAGASTSRTATLSTAKNLSAVSYSIMPSGRFWVGGAGTWNLTTTNWSASSGGAAGAPTPTARDNVTFDSASNATDYTVTLSTTPVCSNLNIAGPATGNVTFAGTVALNINGNLTIAATGVTYTHTGTMLFGGGTSQSYTITTNGKTITSIITIGNSGTTNTWTLGSALTSNATNGITVASQTFSTGNFAVTTPQLNIATSVAAATVINLGSSTITLSPSSGGSAFFVGTGTLTFNAGTSQINVSSSGNFTASLIGLTFYNVTFTSNSIGGVYLTGTGTATFNNFTITPLLNSNLSMIHLSGNIQVNGTLSNLNTDVTKRTLFRSATIGTARTISAAAVNWDNVDFMDITAAGVASPFSGTSFGDGKGNTNITFTAAKTVYWNSPTGSLWSDITWATTSNGTAALANFPLAQDTCTFTNAGNIQYSASNGNNYLVGNINASARTTLSRSYQPNGNVNPAFILGNITLGTAFIISNTGDITYAGRNTQTFTSVGNAVGGNIIINSPGGTFVLADNYTAGSNSNFQPNGILQLTNGTLNLNGKTFFQSNATTSTSFRTNAGTKNITFNGGTLSFINTGSTVFDNFAPTGFTTTAGTGTGVISMIGASAKTFGGAGSTYNCTINQGGLGALTITGSNAFTNITNTTQPASVIFTAGTTSTFTNFSLAGTAGNLITIGSETTASHTLSKASGIVNGNYLSISRSTATGGATWNAGANSTDGGNNSGWIFSALTTIPSSFFLMF